MSISECVCVRCPQGCMIQVSMNEDGSMSVQGNACAKGLEYAIAEVTRPERILTMTIPAAGSFEPLSVKTSAPVPKDMLQTLAKEIKHLHIAIPVHEHDVIVANICGIGVDVVATKSLPNNDG